MFVVDEMLRKVRLVKYLKQLGIDIDVSTFSKRLILQKIVYFLQEAGNHLGYSFGWYIHGPYSPDLTSDLYSVVGILDKGIIPKNFEVGMLSEREKDGINKVKKLMQRIGEISQSEKDKVKWLELLASLHYVLKYMNYKYCSYSEVKGYLRKLKPIFDEKAITEAYQILKELNFV